MALIELSGVSKGFGTGKRRIEILRNINLKIEEGEFVAIVGYSGAGKTTLISMIAGLLPPDSGVMTMNGQAITQPGPDRGVVFQNYSLLPWLTAFQNVALAVDQLFPDWSPAEREAHTRKNLELVKLGEAAHKRPHELSGGMRQRVSVARALAMNPKVLLLDEPFGALDALTRSTLQEELARISAEQGKTILLITNDVEEGILLADRIVPLSAGPQATLGPSIPVDLPKPRDRREMSRSAQWKKIRTDVLGYLLGPGRQRGGQAPAAEAKVSARVSSQEVAA